MNDDFRLLIYEVALSLVAAVFRTSKINIHHSSLFNQPDFPFNPNQAAS